MRQVYSYQTIGDMRFPRVFTSTHVAKICGVSTRTAVKWIDRGRLPSYRVRKDRRVTRDALVAFLKAEGFWDAIPLVSKRLMGLVSISEAYDEAYGLL
jgi:excisionase family DNA binding protein